MSNRGVHLLPFGQHTGWMEKADYWIGLLVSMHMDWCMVLSDSDAFYTSGAAKALLDAGITPIVRFSYEFPRKFTDMDAIAQLVNLYAKYNKTLIVQFANEPFDSREWVDHDVPLYWEAWEIIRDRWWETSKIIVDRGAVAGFPDGPCFDDNPFNIIGDESLYWQDGKAIYCGHYYGKGRPLNYPEDLVSKYGVPLTMEEYREALDVFQDDPDWNEGQYVLDMMNEQRKEWADPSITALDDDVCWWGWKKVLRYSQEAFGFDVRMGMTEGGWVPRDRAGSTIIDIRWPYTTPLMVAKKTLAMFQEDSPLEFLCPWILACNLMGGSGFEDAAWTTGNYRPHYWLELPVIQTLRDNPPDPENHALVKLEAAQVRIDRAIEELRNR